MNNWKVLGISRFNTKKGLPAAMLHLARNGRNMEGQEVYAQFVLVETLPAGLTVGDEVKIMYNRNAFVESIEIVA